jgi:hypothetical protein
MAASRLPAHRTTLYRVIAEAGSIDVPREAVYLRDPRWVEFIYGEALLNGIEEELGLYRVGVAQPEPMPAPAPNPTPGYARPELRPALEQYKGVPDELIPAVVVDGGTAFWHIGREVTVTKRTPRNQVAVAGSAVVGPDLEPGDVFYAWWGGMADRGRPFTYTLWGTRVWLDDTDAGVLDDGAVAA